MGYDCEKGLPKDACARDVKVKVDTYPPKCEDDKKEYGPSKKHCLKAKILVKVGEVDCIQPLKDSIFIKEGFYAIKKIDRRVVIKQCYVVLDQCDDNYCEKGKYPNKNEGFLYVEGYILKNISYATPQENPDCDDDHKYEKDCKSIRNDYNDITSKLDFDFCVPVELEDAELGKAIRKVERSVLRNCMDACDEGSMSESDCEKFHCQTVDLQEPFECELDKYSLSEAVINKRKYGKGNGQFDTIVEKVALRLKIGIFQKQVKKLDECKIY